MVIFENMFYFPGTTGTTIHFMIFFWRGWKHQPGPGGRSKAFLHLCVSTQYVMAGSVCCTVASGSAWRTALVWTTIGHDQNSYITLQNIPTSLLGIISFVEIYWSVFLVIHSYTWQPLVTPVQSRSQQGFCVVPCMDFSGSHVLMESCPASVLKRLELYTEPYKGKTAKHGRRRRVILDRLKMLGCVTRRVGCNYPASFLFRKAPRPQGRMWSFQHVRRGVPIGRNSKSLLSVQMADPHLSVDSWGRLVPCEQVWDEIAMGQNLCFLPFQNLTSGWTSTIARHFDVHQGVDWETDHRKQR